ncbi:MAG: peptidoglycan D,D-transpeptidase FtsI family protein [bacterium JZ-2024 1]
MLITIRAGAILISVLIMGRIVGIYASPKIQSDFRAYESGLVTITGTRGKILDRHGRLLATNRMSYEITVDLDKVSEETREMLKTRYGEYFTSPQGARQVTAVVSPETMANLRELEGWKGITIRRNVGRVYPMGIVAGPVVGFEGKSGGRGLEFLLDGVLEGRPGVLPARSRRFGEAGFLGGSPPEFSGYDVVLTLDTDVQAIAEDALHHAVADSGAIGGAGLVLDLTRGEYLALASEPRYDPNDPEKAEYEILETGERVKKIYEPGGEPWDWKPLNWGFEPGSTLKPVVVAIALEAGIIEDPETFEYECTGTRRVADRTIKEFNNEVHGHIDLTHLIAESCNLAASLVGESIPKETWKTWMTRLELGKPATVLDPQRIPTYSVVERVPRVRENWTNVDRANRGFGQGLEVTPVQLARLYTAFALGGIQQKPCWIREVRTASGRLHWRCRRQVNRVFSEEVAHWVKSALEAVVAEGTGIAAQLRGIRVAGKTGTAQKAVPIDADRKVWVYSREKLVVSFIGFFPSEKPKYLVGVFLNEPKVHLASGGKLAAPAFRRIASKLAWRDNMLASGSDI